MIQIAVGYRLYPFVIHHRFIILGCERVLISISVGCYSVIIVHYACLNELLIIIVDNLLRPHYSWLYQSCCH